MRVFGANRRRWLRFEWMLMDHGEIWARFVRALALDALRLADGARSGDWHW